MKIELERIKDEGVEIEEYIPAALWNMDSSDVTFVDNIHLNCKFVKANIVIVTDVSVTTHQQIICSRCLNRVRKTLRQDFKKNYSLDELDDSLNIDEEIREEILLNFPMKVLCSPDCKGICLGCGVDLNFQNCKCSDSPLEITKQFQVP